MSCANLELQTNIQHFFKNKSVFVTGGTGFLGKLIVNKLIRSCPQIKHIYLLIRDKKGKTAHERLEDIFNMPVRILYNIFAGLIIFRCIIFIQLL